MLMCKRDLEKPHLELTVNGLQGHKHQVTFQPCCPLPRPFLGPVSPRKEGACTSKHGAIAASAGHKCRFRDQMRRNALYFRQRHTQRQRATLCAKQSWMKLSCSSPLTHTTRWELLWGRSSQQLFPLMKCFWFFLTKRCHDILTASARRWFSHQGLTRQTPMHHCYNYLFTYLINFRAQVPQAGLGLTA